MNKIKIIGAFIFILSVSLAVLSNLISQNNQINSELISTINEQKAFTQEISKNIFYIYKNKNASTSQLNNSIKSFISNMQTREKKLNNISSKNIQEQTDKIILLWNEFYSNVQDFRDLNKITTAYSNVILEKIVKNIYNTNLKLVVEFDKLLKMNQEHFEETQKSKKTLQYTLYILLIISLIYLFTQLKTIIFFMQKFLNTSKSIITNSSIKELKPIEVNKSSEDILQASNNFNFLVQKINSSIENSSLSIEHSYKSVELIEKNIEGLLELFYEMQENKEFDKELTKKEDALIQSLEELTTSAQKLKDLKINLDNLIAHK